MPRGPERLAVLVVALAVLGACSGGGDDGETAAVAANRAASTTTSTSSSTTALTTTTTVPPATTTVLAAAPTTRAAAQAPAPQTGGPTPPNNPPPAAPAPPPSPTTTRPADIVIQGFMFSPADKAVSTGQPVKVENRDGARHTFTSNGGAWPACNLNGGQSCTITAPAPGSYAYRCDLHATMTGTLTVT